MKLFDLASVVCCVGSDSVAIEFVLLSRKNIVLTYGDYVIEIMIND